MIELVFDGHTPPSVEQITERAGVSIASLFRYFETLDELREFATAHYFAQYSHMFELPDIGVGTLHERIDGLVRARVEQHETTHPMARLVRSRAVQVSDLDATLHRLRATQADQLRLHFADELRALSTARRDDIVATLSTLTSYESWDQFRHDHSRTPIQVRRAWSAAIHGLLDRP